jgi:uncharacterized protein (TIGR02271 family)
MSEGQSIPLLEEELTVSKRAVETGRVRIQTSTESYEQLVESQLESTEVDVIRVPIGRLVQSTPEPRTEGDVTIIPVMEEILVVEKRLVLKEELHIRRRVTLQSVEVPVSLRKQHAIVTRSQKDEATPTNEEYPND